MCANIAARTEWLNHQLAKTYCQAGGSTRGRHASAVLNKLKKWMMLMAGGDASS